jgi:hypothetical protein
VKSLGLRIRLFEKHRLALSGASGVAISPRDSDRKGAALAPSAKLARKRRRLVRSVSVFLLSDMLEVFQDSFLFITSRDGNSRAQKLAENLAKLQADFVGPRQIDNRSVRP